MQYTPLTDEEYNNLMDDTKPKEYSLLPDGDYMAEIVDQNTEKRSKKTGQPMTEVKLKIILDDNTYRFIYDYMSEPLPEAPPATHNFFRFKVKSYFNCFGMANHYAKGVITDEFLNRKGMVSVKTVKDPTGQYKDKNSIAKYIPLDNSFFQNSYSKPVPTLICDNNDGSIYDDIPF